MAPVVPSRTTKRYSSRRTRVLWRWTFCEAGEAGEVAAVWDEDNSRSMTGVRQAAAVVEDQEVWGGPSFSEGG